MNFLSPFFLRVEYYIFTTYLNQMSKTGLKYKFIKVLASKYFIATLLFVVWIVFFDENSIVSHEKNKKQLKQLVNQKEYYIDRIASDKQKLEDLNAGNEELEKFAREQYLMSKPDEDVFIIVEED